MALFDGAQSPVLASKVLNMTLLVLLVLGLYVVLCLCDSMKSETPQSGESSVEVARSSVH